MPRPMPPAKKARKSTAPHVTVHIDPKDEDVVKDYIYGILLSGAPT